MRTPVTRSGSIRKLMRGSKERVGGTTAVLRLSPQVLAWEINLLVSVGNVNLNKRTYVCMYEGFEISPLAWLSES